MILRTSLRALRGDDRRQPRLQQPQKNTQTLAIRADQPQQYIGLLSGRFYLFVVSLSEYTDNFQLLKLASDALMLKVDLLFNFIV